MVATSLLLWALAAAPPSLAEPDFSLANVNAEVAKFAAEHLATQLNSRGIRVVSSGEIAALIGQERQKQLLGCSETSTSCLTELANALGTDGTLLGQLGRFGGSYQVNLKVIRSDSGELLATWSRTVGSEDKLIAALTDAAKELSVELMRKLRPGSVPAEAPKAERDHHWPLWPTIAAGGLGVAGGVLYAVAESKKSQLTNPDGAPLSPGDAKSIRSSGELTQNLARVAAGLAVAGVVTSAVIYAVGSEPVKETSVGVALVPGGGGVSMTWVLP